MSRRKREKKSISGLDQDSNSDNEVNSKDDSDLSVEKTNLNAGSARVVYSTHHQPENLNVTKLKVSSKEKRSSDPTKVPKGSFYLHDNRENLRNKRRDENQKNK